MRRVNGIGPLSWGWKGGRIICCGIRCGSGVGRLLGTLIGSIRGWPTRWLLNIVSLRMN